MAHIQKYGLIGKKLGHSFSKQFFTDYFSEKGSAATYENLEFETNEELATFFQSTVFEYHGLNVTIPYKEAVLPFLGELSDEVQQIKAVNLIQVNNGKLKGYNTDAYGFQQSIKPFLTNQHERALILGTGGASKAVHYVLKQLGIDCIFISRNPNGNKQFAYNQINNHMLNACKLIVNCTPVGMYPHVNDCIDLPFDCLTPQHLVVDLIYNPTKTQLLQKSEDAGAQILNGDSMLKQQALKAIEILGL
ncbi:MAG TPA: shikimate dehydrogenase [Taishania sp.]|nr:shikimate dehydrogenase [Taishania sp.]HNS42587.1 shikimate dehydrogenase [Taishania sp.]